MSPASRSKSKDKRAAVKEPQKSPSKPASTGGYNPLLGTFHTVEPNHLNSRCRNNEDTDDHSGPGVEYDSLSNNGSWSGESEDHHKEKPSSRQDPIPGDKREKIRQKNEKKHQRQKERRAQELHERCSGYLMSRKLEALSQQLVAMGFSSERATMALILNEGRVEQSVAWLFEVDNQREHNESLDSGGNLKIDISEELVQIAAMEIKFKCSKQEVERAVVASEGHLEQAAETLKAQKLPKPDETTTATAQNPPAGQNSKPAIDDNYTKTPPETGLKLLKKIQPNPELTKQQAGAATPEKRPNPSPVQAKTETQFKNLHLREPSPVIVMQRPKSKNIPTSVSSSSSPNGLPHAPITTRTFTTPPNAQFHYHQQPPHHYPMNHFGTWNRTAGGTATPTLAAAASLGLFSGSSGPPSPVDWNAGDTLQFDYTTIDWSLDKIPARPSAATGGAAALNGTGGLLHTDGAGSEASAGEWTSPFEEKDLFSFSRQFVSSPSL